jgi:uncharacterized delta-60 repeat protein
MLSLLTGAAAGAPGDLDASFNPNANSEVWTTALQGDGKIIAGGKFTSIGGATRTGFARLNVNGTADAGFQGPLFLDTTELSMTCAVLADGSILSGRGVRVAGNTNVDFAKFTSGGVVDQSFVAPNLGGVQCLLIQDDGKIIAGGGFQNVGGTGRSNLVRLNAGGSVDTTFNASVAGINASVFSMAWQTDGKILIAGTNISTVGGVPRTLMARLNPNGALDGTFNPSITGNDPRVSSLTVQPDGKIIICGNFTTVNGQSIQNMARLNPNGSLDTQFTSPFPTTPFGGVGPCALLTDGRIAIGGSFEMLGSLARNGFAILHPDGSPDTAFNTPVTGEIYGMAVQADGSFVFCGPFAFLSGGTRRNGMARIAGYPATQTLAATNTSTVRWLRGGGAPEVLRVRFELSTNGGSQWTSLGEGVRIAGGWERAGLTLPSTGRLRARAPAAQGMGNGSQGWVESVADFIFAPEVAVHNGATDTAPELSDGQTQAVDFGTARLGTPVARELTVTNTGTADLHLTGIAAPPGFSVTGAQPFPAVIRPGESITVHINLNATATGLQSGIINIASDDADEAVFNFPVTGLVVTPEIAVHDGTSATSPELTDGQTVPVDFGTTRQTSPVIRGVTIVNTGTAPLLLSAAAAPAGFTILNLPALPATVGINESITLGLRLDAAASGTFAGSVFLSSDDFDETVFDFPIKGTVVTPEIAVHDGVPAGPELMDGQAAKVDFGRNVQGTPGTRSFTVSNTGTAELKISGVTVPPGYNALNVQNLPFLIGINQSATFQVSLTITTVGTYSGSVIIASDDLDEAVFDFPIAGEVFVPEPVATTGSTTTALNRQTGLREQTIHITNDTTATVPAYNLIIRGLPPGVEVNNASETRADGSVVVYIRRGLHPHTSQDIVIEYYSANRTPVEITPQLSTEVVLTPPDLSAPAGETGLTIENVRQLTGGEMLIEFTTEPGKRYQIQYSPDGLSWQNSLPQIHAAANRTQWIDRGLPRTDSHPAQAGSRIYRVRELAP